MSLTLIPILIRAVRANGTVVAGARVRARLTVEERDNGLIVPLEVDGQTNQSGECVLNLWPNSRGVNGSNYRVVIDGDAIYFSGLITVSDVPSTAWPVLMDTLINQPPYPARSVAEQAQIAAVLSAQLAKGDRDEVARLTDIARTARNQAVAAENTALAASSTAAAIANLWPNTDLGLQNTAENSYFSTPSTNPKELAIIWKKVSGAAVDTGGRVPSSASIQALSDALRVGVDGYVLSFIDKIGQLGLSVTPELLWTFYGELDATLSDAAKARLFANGTDQLRIGNLTIGIGELSFFEACDKAGNVWMRVDAASGKVWFDPDPDMARRVQAVLAADAAASAGVLPRIADYTHIWVHGQSLSVGISTNSTLSGLTALNVAMPNYGVLDCTSWGDGLTGTVSASTSIIPLNGGTNARGGEPPGISIASQFALQAVIPQTALVSHSGHGSYAIAQLDKAGSGAGATQPYQLAVNQAASYKSIANASGKTFETSALIWIHGEADISNGTSAATYKSRLLQLRQDYASDTEQRLPLLLISQVASHTRRWPGHAPDIGIAQWDLSCEHADVVLVCPMYMLTYQPSDGVHLTAHSSRQLGCYFGKALYQTLVKKKKWRPLEPIDIWRQGKVINIDLFVPSGELVLDTTLVTDPGNYGFEVIDSTGATLTISSVAVSGSRVQIVLSATPASLVTVGYALGSALTGANAGRTTGARGCLRDSDPTFAWANDSDGQPYKLYNWCVMFKLQESN